MLPTIQKYLTLAIAEENREVQKRYKKLTWKIAKIISLFLLKFLH